MKPIYSVLLGIAIIIVFFCMTQRFENKINKLGLVDENIKLTGIIVDLDSIKGYSGYGIITLGILKTNIDEYDPRRKLRYF